MTKSDDTGLTCKEILQLFHYNRRNGTLGWRRRPVSMFNATAGRTAEHACNNWNALYAYDGNVAGHETAKGYIVVGIHGRLYLVHLLIWCIEHGTWPDFEVDHKDTDGLNNRIGNLRPAHGSQQNYNTRIRNDNTSGCKGVNWYKSRNLWLARITVNRKGICLGYYDNYDDAVAIRKAAEVKYHGSFRYAG